MADSIIVGVEKRALSSLLPYSDNANLGDTEAITQSMERFGVFNALVVDVDTNEVLAGNHRLHALMELGQTEAYCIFVKTKDKAHRDGINVADNGTGRLAKWDAGLLLKQIEESFDGDLTGTGISDDYLSQNHGRSKAQGRPNGPRRCTSPTQRGLYETGRRLAARPAPGYVRRHDRSRKRGTFDGGGAICRTDPRRSAIWNGQGI